MQLFIEPLDVWLFRDGRPFDALSDHRAESVFPPYPSVMQGVIRSHQLALRGVDLHPHNKQAIADEVGTGEDFRQLRIRGPLIARWDEQRKRLIRYFPRPADAALDGSQVHALTPQDPPAGIISSVPTRQWLLPAGEPQKPSAGDWLDEDALADYLDGKQVETVKTDTLFCKESRFGIAHDARTRTVREGALYEVEYVRPLANVGLWLAVEGYPGWPPTGVMRMGGEGRGGSYQVLANVPAWPAPLDPLPKRFKIYFAAPTYFDGGWQPVNGDWSRFFEGDVKLVAAAVNRFESVGGYDLARRPSDPNAHRPARRYVPAGSVYFFVAHGEARVRPDLIQGAITDFALKPNLGAEIGFGQVLIKEW
jgi:CRISPR-associated protein Cmr3